MQAKMKSISAVIGYVSLFMGLQIVVTIIAQLGILVKLMMDMGQEAYFELAMNAEILTQILVESMSGYTLYIILVCDLIVLGVIWLIAKCRRQKLRDKISLKQLSTPIIGIMTVIGLGMYCFNIGFVEILGSMEMFRWGYMQLEEISSNMSAIPVWVSLMIVGIIVPFVEEVLFRGVIYQALNKRFSVAIAIVVQAVLFGVVHMNSVQMVYATLIGSLCGYAVYRTGSLWSGVVIHVVNNMVSSIGTLLNLEGISMGMPFVIGALVIGSIVVYTGIRILNKATNPVNISIHEDYNL